MKYFVIFMVLGVIAVPFIGSAIDSAACSIKWDGFKTEYSLLSGCKVEIEGHMVPENAVRFGE